ncbi:3-oxoacyl-ACP reductase [Moritella viscosa]|uniref:3-ketoacyl-(Acyl-carrier-protein) reductase n=1 Tax=Moritella viscosa TaxID=80854 RepID=A0ABY1HLQ7_9GAMM|nr:3-oxoacyl-ACP reductase [Moritella viscosa]CED60035.1 short-chain dehydrogenase [Moritella viscosa]SGY99589.1 3-ketoacyl-(Acyl-carrier-protein) reductase [Moritella viscosa]SGZ14598.1 3-ketoacyl-(Acyl-carrier-protein) reductase [Moritella viscosa]SHO15169.1 3-ketoacyl-(Acyl-carrier-protein) reductase [Moritella viscosa]SHO27967.1 3-ketoacyl-(Acyl-carrier-protein) reductase [Moritella viscosa]
MTDTYAKIANGKWTSALFKMLNLPQPVTLTRFSHGSDLISGRLLIGAATNSDLIKPIIDTFNDAELAISYPNSTLELANLNEQFNNTLLSATPISLNTMSKSDKFNCIVFDASGIKTSKQLSALHRFFQPVIKQLSKCSRVIVLGRPSEHLEDVSYATVQRSLEGFCRSLAKEIGKNGSTCQLMYAQAGSESLLNAPLRFLTSTKSAYISAQVLNVKPGAIHGTVNLAKPLQGKTALVTGASRGIGAAIAETLARDGAHVICLDIPALKMDLDKIAHRLKGSTIVADITSDDAPTIIAEFVREVSLDIIVHNAGVTKDKTLARMTNYHWDVLMDINLSAMERINERLLSDNLLNQYGRIICVSSMSGIAGNFGQTNYATSKAAVIGYVNAMQKPLAEKNITINAVAPGFIETKMTAAIPFTVREAGRRMNSLKQGGKPIDVAEAIAFFAQPQAAGVTGNTIRICGQSLIGA